MARIWKAALMILVVVACLAAGLLVGERQSHGARQAPERTYTAYFYKTQEDAPGLGAVLVPVLFPLPPNLTSDEQMRLPFQALCNKPPAGFSTSLLRGCKVISAKMGSDGVLTVDFTADVFGAQGTSGEDMVAQQLRMTASQFGGVHRLKVAYQGKFPTDLGSHGMGNDFAADGRSVNYLVTPPVRVGERVDTASLSPRSTAVRNATAALGRPMLGLINRRLSELGYSQRIAREVEYVIPSGDGTLWVGVRDQGGLYRVRWDGREWQVEGMP